MAVPPVPSKAMELFLHPGDEYLGSLEPESLQVLTYIKLYLQDLKSLDIKTSCIPRQFPSERPPYLKIRGVTVASGVDNIITYLREQTNSEERLNELQQSEMSAFSALLTDRLLPAIMYSKWLNSENYIKHTRSSYTSLLYFPLTLFYLSWQHRTAKHLLMRGAPSHLTEEQRGYEVLSKAEECIGHISTKLGDQAYFNGERPSSVDVYVFGYLEVLLQSPHSATDALAVKISSCTNLVNYCKKMRKQLYPDKQTRAATSGGDGLLTTHSTLWKDSTFWISLGVVTAVLGIQASRVGLLGQLGRWMRASSTRSS